MNYLRKTLTDDQAIICLMAAQILSGIAANSDGISPGEVDEDCAIRTAQRIVKKVLAPKNVKTPGGATSAGNP